MTSDIYAKALLIMIDYDPKEQFFAYKRLILTCQTWDLQVTLVNVTILGEYTEMNCSSSAYRACSLRGVKGK